MNKRKRLALGVGVACGLHLVIAGLLPGLLSFLPQPLKAKIIEVNIVDLGRNSSGQSVAAGLQSSVERQAKTARTETVNAAQAETAVADATAPPDTAPEPQSTYGQPAVAGSKTSDSAPDATNSAPSPAPATENTAGSNNIGGGQSSADSGSDNGSTDNGSSSNGSDNGSTGSGSSSNGSGAAAEPAKRPGEGELANRPRLLSGGKNYPSAARSAGQQGTVLIHVNIDSGGQVTGASLAGSSGYPLLDNAALNAVYSWSFSPATDPYGTPLPYSGTIPIEYSLQN